MRAAVPSALIAAAATIALCSVVAPAAAGHAMVFGGAWLPIKDVNKPYIQELGGWAVSEHVKKANDGLRFGKVVRGEEQEVAWTNYKLVIEATNGDGNSATYGAEVYEQEWTNTRELVAFKPAHN